MSTALQINLRINSKNPNEGVADKPRIPKPIGCRNRYVFLVHGFAVSEANARDAYWNYARAVGGPDFDIDFTWRKLKTIGVTWPGDTISSMPWENQANYAFRVRHAIKSGQVFGRYLKGLSAPNNAWQPEIVLIGHSLGCRMILEALDTFDELKGDLGKVQVCLMAAATPEGLVTEPVKKELPKLQRAFSAVGLSYVAYSLRDLVLQCVFEPGQFWARNLIKNDDLRDTRDPGPRTRAIGRRGLPPSRKTVSIRTERTFGHGGYWKDPHVARSFAKCVFDPKYAGELSSKQPADRPVPARIIPDRFIKSYLGRNRFWSRR